MVCTDLITSLRTVVLDPLSSSISCVRVKFGFVRRKSFPLLHWIMLQDVRLSGDLFLVLNRCVFNANTTDQTALIGSCQGMRAHRYIVTRAENLTLSGSLV